MKARRIEVNEVRTSLEKKAELLREDKARAEVRWHGSQHRDWLRVVAKLSTSVVLT